MAMSDAVIIEAAINGATTKARNPHVPISVDEIVADAQACFDAGASIVHHHLAADRLSGAEAAEGYLEVWRRVLADRPDALWYPTINIGPRPNWYDHITPLAESGLLRMSVSDPGSVNLGRRRDGVPAGSFVYANSFDDIAHQFALCRDHQLGPSIAVYEPGFLRAVLAHHRHGTLPAGAFVKLYLCADDGLTGTAFGLPPTEPALAAYLELLAGTGLTWAVSAVGGDLGRTDVCPRCPRRRRPPARRSRVLRRRPHAHQRRARARGGRGVCRRRAPGRLLRGGSGHPRPPVALGGGG